MTQPPPEPAFLGFRTGQPVQTDRPAHDHAPHQQSPPFFQPLVTEMADRKLRVHPSLSQAGDKPHGITGTGQPQGSRPPESIRLTPLQSEMDASTVKRPPRTRNH